MRKRKKTYISTYQIKKYGFIINKRMQTDLEAFILNDNLTIRLFNYDYYTVSPDRTLIIDINGERVFEGHCNSRQTFQKIMKRLKISTHTFSHKFTTLYNYDIVKNGDYVRFLSSDGEYINCQVKERVCDNIHCETGNVMKKGSLYIHNQFFDIKDYRNAELQPF